MQLESVEPQFSLYTLSGFASFAATDKMEAELLHEAELGSLVATLPSRPSPTTFHLAVCEGVPIGVATSTVGPLAELPLGLAMRAAGVDIETEIELPGPTCELVSVSVDPAAARDTVGVTEALYRSFYRQAKQSSAQSAVVGVDPWIYDILTEQYGVPFEVLGPPLDLLGRELLAVGGRLDLLEEGIRRNAPEFFAYLELPYGIQGIAV